LYHFVQTTSLVGCEAAPVSVEAWAAASGTGSGAPAKSAKSGYEVSLLNFLLNSLLCNIAIAAPQIQLQAQGKQLNN
jgi:hypothetical protein